MDSVLMLLNEGGYFLMGSVPHEEWGFMFPDKKHLRFNYRHPEAWERITREKDGSLYTERGLYTFASVSPYPENGALKIAGEGTSWRIVSFAPRTKLTSLRAALTRRYVILNILFMLISVVVASAITALRLGKKAAEEKLRLLAATDPLTALLNRRAFLDRFEYERVRSMRYDEPVSVIMGDIDHFKQVNDSKGHQAGDYVLKTIGTILKSNLREQDSVCRWGGEEFIVMLPQTGVRNAVETAEKLRKIIEAYGFVHDGSRLNVTISFGVALCRRGMSVEECIHMADRMMYQSKAGGRNRVSHEHRH
jgi:diguanylate cyclase (GGDEF)-like protein